MVINVSEQGRECDYIIRATTLVASQTSPAQANRDERTPTQTIGRQQSCQRLVQQVGAIQRHMTRGCAMLSIGMNGGQRQTGTLAVVAGTCQQCLQKAADLRSA